MKWPAILLIIAAAGISAATFRYNVPVTGEKVTINSQAVIRCSPLYVPTEEETIPPLTGWGNYHWKITTSADSAQFYFNQGINMYYAFHIIEARASFDKAARFDPACAMAWWGKALAFGPNINDFGYLRPSEAFASAAKAVELKSTCTATEKALIDAMAVRYSADTTKDQNQLNILYRDAMGTVYKTYVHNADVSTLYADALMLLHPWDLYNHDYSPKPWTAEIVSTIKKIFTLNPLHPGANHYYIHAMEASATPQEALKSANFLSTAMPLVSHVTHMPSHIYIRTGHYSRGIEQNEKAVNGYQQYVSSFAPVNEGMALYSLHNIHMKVNCAQMAGNYRQAMVASKQIQSEIPAFYLSIPGAVGQYVQYLNESSLFTQIRFGRWEEILHENVVDSLPYTSLLQHFGRGLAYARTGRSNDAEKELGLLRTSINNAALKEPMAPFNSAYDASVIAENILAGVIAEQQKDFTRAVTYLEKAVLKEDSLIYNEPRDWLLPARQYLGHALLKAGKYQEALTVFKADLAVHPNNGWDLTGMETALTKLNNKSLLAQVRARLKAAWPIRDTEIQSAVF